MKVKQLVKKLLKMDQEMDIAIEGDNGFSSTLDFDINVDKAYYKEDEDSLIIEHQIAIDAGNTDEDDFSDYSETVVLYV